MKKKLLVFISIIAFLFLAACSNDSASGGESTDNKEGIDSFTYASLTDAVGLSPILTNDSASANVTDHVYEKLFERNAETMEIEPKLAESYENPEENTWVIKLKEGIKFHDGTDFNAEAVKYTFDKLRDPATAAPRASLMEPVDTITVIDDYTVEIKTKYPYGPFLASLSHSNAAIVSPEADKAGDINKEPVGTGPFKFVSWVPGDQVVLESNSDYHDGEPEIKKMIFKVVPEISTAISMLQAGEVQFIDKLPTEQLSRVESLKNVAVEKVDGTPQYYFTVNHSKEELQDPELKEALASAIDRDAFISKMNGLGIRSDSVIGPKVFGYDESADKAGTPFDVERAKELVKKNGYDKQPLTLLTPNRNNYILMAEVVQAQLTDAGFNVKIESMEWASFLDTARDGNYDITFLSWSNLTADGSELFYPNFHSDNVGSSNRAQYSNPEFDKLVEESRTTTDQEKRLEILDQANKLMMDDNAVVVMYHDVVTAALESSYEGLILEPTGKWNVSKVTRK
ncbi:ABC transporter substrate-binding protein [Cytobacillus purgationiresistens]|uniref:Peptide/nickel transport system substrate-binding protein n=1 Tax=Cytobacillus purgationiresistens TaxID=863449 RepID=A0ABU0AKK5_9BACI|nr:ABC transporter substrate-binding protein [Cytobacillus purgationiresistens]MDQ0271795.1 peptide/nickel transport system substrate-binding protein [Cytobacillus purgationiresistens]